MSKSCDMDIFFIEHRDPIFGLVVLFAIIFMIAVLSYVWGIFKGKDEKRQIEKFIKKFENLNALSIEHKNLLQNLDIDAQSLNLLGLTFSKNGDFEKAISIYIIALEKVKNKAEKELILTELGQVYFKAGFLQNSMDVFLKSVEISPRNAIALRFLTMIDEKLKRYDDALETLTALNELGVDVRANEAYINALKILDDKSIEPKEKIAKILEFQGDFELVKRMCMQVYIRQGISLNNLPQFPRLSDAIDLLYSQENAVNLKDGEYHALFYAKGVVDEPKEIKSFELNVIKILKDSGFNKAQLSFSYVCKHCKNSFPMHFYRCPMCHELGSVSIIPNITEKPNENNMPF
ncbi:hypothetical protein [Campylobacter mucosalis]|uniref:hypothetical protein n=1 Tax=Campylobacter mucosalis TaxID=202 RepID=UPI002016940A|nr:hypothetical protein [Campylobacter mucosalis]